MRIKVNERDTNKVTLWICKKKLTKCEWKGDMMIQLQNTEKN